MDWLPNVERISCGTSGGTYLGGPFRITLHRTEGSNAEGAMAAYKANNFPPHLTVDLARRRVIQHLPFSTASRALQNLPGGVETNRRSNIQIEIVGFSAQSQFDKDDDVRWFGATALGPIMRAYNIKAEAPTFYGEDCGWTLAKASAKQRFSFAAWNSFNGVCSHQHVPEQSHWDAGQFKIALALSAATAVEDDDLTPDQDKALANIEGIVTRALDTQRQSRVVDAKGVRSSWNGFATDFIENTNADTFNLVQRVGALEAKLDQILAAVTK